MQSVTEEELLDRAKFFCKYFFNIPFIFEIVFFHEDEPAIRGCFHARTDDGAICEDAEEYDYYIELNDNLVDILDLNDTLIHELIHYRNWYFGFNSDDDAEDFIKIANELGVSNNYERDYSKKIDGYFDFKRDDEKLKRYEKAYQIYREEE